MSKKIIKPIIFNDDIKRNILDCLGYAVNGDGIVYSQDNYGMLCYKGKFLSFDPIPAENLERKKIYFDILNIGIMSWLFNMYMYNYMNEEPDLYIKNFYEDIIKDYPYPRSCIKMKGEDDSIIFQTGYYILPTFKFIDAIFRLEETYVPEDKLPQFDFPLMLDWYQTYLENESLKRQKALNKLYKKR